VYDRAVRTLAALLVLLAACTNLSVPPAASEPPGASPAPIATLAPAAAGTPTPAATVMPTPPATVLATAEPTLPPTPQATASDAAETPPSDTAAALLAHMPDAMDGDCMAVTSFDAGVIGSVQCINIDGLDGYLVYTRFDTVANLVAAYDGDLDFFGEEATGGTCESEAAEGGYTIGGTPAGRLFCAPYDGGIIAAWTHEDFLILATMVLNEEDYPAFWSLWQVAGPDPADSDPLPTSSPSAEPMTWFDTAVQYRGRNGERITFVCPADGSPTAIYGTDTYTDDSSICVAAVHAGLITFEAGGPVTIEIRPGQDSYAASTRNGVTSSTWGTWSGSFVFVP
jgi:hypothetical protein